MNNKDTLQRRYFAFEDSIMLEARDGAIEITEQQHKDALTAMKEGRRVFVKDGKLIIYTGRVVAYLKSDCKKKKPFDDITLVTDDYTLDAPKTRFDQWINDEWVTNLENQYQAKLLQFNYMRYYLYFDLDRLQAEGKSTPEIKDYQARAQEYLQQANEFYLTITAEKPLPTLPDAL